MDIASIVATIDAEIAKLEQARAIILVGSTNGTVAAAPKKRRRRRLSAEARKRIADAQRKRWAAQKAKK